MAYHAHIIERVKKAPCSLGAQLGRLAIKHKVSVQEVARRTGASRVTVYSWFSGGGVTNAYQPAVKKLIETLKQK